MDKDRQIRFLYPPLILFGSLLYGAYTGSLEWKIRIDNWISAASKDSPIANLVTIVAGGSLLIIVVGFIVGTFTHVTFRWLNKHLFNREFEFVVSPATLERIRSKIPGDPGDKGTFHLPIGATFCHDILPEGVSNWIVRRWHAVNLSLSSCTALVGAWIIGYPLRIDHHCGWGVLTVAFLVVFGVNSHYAWHDTMEMYEFQSYRKFEQ